MNTKVNKSGDTMNGRLVNSHAIGPFTVRTSNYNNNISNNFFGSDLTIDSEDDINHFFFAGSNFTNNDIRARVVCSKKIDGNLTYSELYVGLRQNGTAYSSAPQCNDNTSIVTTVSHGSNYVRFGNGLQICWGVGGAGTVTLPVPFANTKYQVTTSQVGGGHTYNCGTENYTTTSFNITNHQSHWIAIGYWY